MIKSPSNLSLSSSDSYQSLTDLTIECCICLEEVEHKDSYMPDCLHSWCKTCNDKLNKESIKKCPICKNNFISILKKGRWKFNRNAVGGYWEWEKGSEDSKKKIIKKKIQQFFMNTVAPIPSNGIGLSGISI